MSTKWSTRCSFATAEARQIGDGLTRDAVQALAAQVDAPAGASVVVNPTARARTGLVEVTLPGSGPVQVLDAAGAPRPTQIIGEISGEAYATMVTGQKVRWVLDLIRGTEFAGRDITSYEITERDAATASTRSCCRKPGPATRAAISPSCANGSSSSARRATP